MNAGQFREIPLFATLSPEESEELLSVVEKENYPPNSTIFWIEKKVINYM